MNNMNNMNEFRIRRSMLFLPGNNPGMLQNGGVFGADAVILDLEDAVSPKEKDTARILVGEALKTVDYGKSEKVVRINTLDTFGREDIKTIVPCRPDALLIPKVESPEDILEAISLVADTEQPGQPQVKFIALLETPNGISQSGKIAKADSRVTALALGAEDYTAAIGARRSKESNEIYYARSIVVNSAAAAGIQAIDTPFTDVNDNSGLIKDTTNACQLGFKGKLAINPRQINDIHNVFNPKESDVDWALRVLEAIRQAEAEGSGVTAVDGKMIDAPIVKRANHILTLAEHLGMIKEEMATWAKL